MPGSPHKASIGMLAPRAMLTVTPAAQSSAVRRRAARAGPGRAFRPVRGAGGGDVRQFVGFGQQAPRIAVDLGKHDQRDGKISGALRITESRARTAAGMQRKRAQVIPSSRIPEHATAGGEGSSNASKPRQQQANAGHAQSDRPALAQKALHGLAEGMRSAEIAVPGGAKIPGVVAENVVFAPRDWRKARTLSALRPGSSSRSSESKPERGAPAWPKAGRRAGRSRRSRPGAGRFSRKRFPRCRFRYEHHSVLIHRCGARARLRRVRSPLGSEWCASFTEYMRRSASASKGSTQNHPAGKRRRHAHAHQIASSDLPARFNRQQMQRLAFSLAASGLSPERRSRIHRRPCGRHNRSRG